MLLRRRRDRFQLHALDGPYLDGFSATQHKYGSVAPIRAALARLKQKR